jgi:hypothetical protein
LDPTDSTHSVPASIDATLFQVRLALFWLIQSAQVDPAVSARIEGLDDIETQMVGGRELIQSKHHHTAAALSDRSVELWKTLRVWSEAISAIPDLPTYARFTLVTTRLCASGSMIEKLARSDKSRSVSKEVAQAFRDIASSAGNKANEKAYEAYLALSESDQQALLLRTRVIDGFSSNTSVDDDIANLLRGTVTGQPQLRALVNQLLGWWEGRVAQHFRDRRDEISGKELFEQIRAIADSLAPDSLPIDEGILGSTFDDAIPDDEIYVKQLRLIACKKPVLLRAMTDLVKSQKHIAAWVREELLFIQEFPNYKRRLQDEWQIRHDFLKGDAESVVSQQEVERLAQKFYQQIQTMSMPIRRDCLDLFVMRGTFHELANEMRVGWHPDYDKLL